MKWALVLYVALFALFIVWSLYTGIYYENPVFALIGCFSLSGACTAIAMLYGYAIYISCDFD